MATTPDLSQTSVAPPTPRGAGPATRPKVDWEVIERDFRAGLLSVREIAVAHGVSHTAVNKRAKADGWERDLKAKILAKAEAEVSKRAVSTEVSTAQRATEREIVEANADVIVRVRMEHRTDISRSRRLTNSLLSELEQQTAQVPELQELGEILRRPDDKGMDKLNDLYQAIISLPERSKTMKVLVESLQRLVLLERQAFGLDADVNDDSGDKSFLEAMLNARARAANR